MDQRWCAVLREVVDDGVATGVVHVSPTRRRSVARVSALLDGLSVADPGLPHA